MGLKTALGLISGLILWSLSLWFLKKNLLEITELFKTVLGRVIFFQQQQTFKDDSYQI